MPSVKIRPGESREQAGSTSQAGIVIGQKSQGPEAFGLDVMTFPRANKDYLPVSRPIAERRLTMIDMSGDHFLAAPISEVWQALNSPEILAACIPGCESMEKPDDDRFTATVLASVGPVRARFQGEITLSEINAPSSCTLSAEGKGGAAGFAKGSARVTLADAEGGTTLHYEATATVGGKLARIGSRLVAGSARKIADGFFTAFARQFETADAAETGENPVSQD